MGGFVVMAFACGGLMLWLPTIPSIPKAKPTASATGQPTLENFYKVEMGMPIDQVFKLLGKNCELMAESELARGTEFQTNTAMFVWEGEWGANCHVMVQDGKVISKAQFGLR